MTAKALGELRAWALPAVSALPTEHLLASLQKHAIALQLDGELTAAEYRKFIGEIQKKSEVEAEKFVRETASLSAWDRTVLWEAKAKKAVADGYVTADGKARKPSPSKRGRRRS